MLNKGAILILRLYFPSQAVSRLIIKVNHLALSQGIEVNIVCSPMYTYTSELNTFLLNT